MNRNRIITIWSMIAGVILGAGLATGAALASARPSTDSPPQCFLVRIVQPAPTAPLWVRFCGTGSNGTSPLEEGVSGHGPLLVDGSHLTPADCRKGSPCVIVWPASPPS